MPALFGLFRDLSEISGNFLLTIKRKSVRTESGKEASRYT